MELILPLVILYFSSSLSLIKYSFPFKYFLLKMIGFFILISSELFEIITLFDEFLFDLFNI